MGWRVLRGPLTLGDLAEKNQAMTQRVVEITRLGQEIQRDVRLAAPAALLDPAQRGFGTAFEVDNQVRRLQERHHVAEDLAVVLVVAVVHAAAPVQRGREDLDVLVDGAVLHRGTLVVQDELLHLEPLAEEVDLQVEAPPFHVLVVVVQVGIVDHGLEVHLPAENLADHGRDHALAHADVAGHRHVKRGLGLLAQAETLDAALLGLPPT